MDICAANWRHDRLFKPSCAEVQDSDRQMITHWTSEADGYCLG